MSAQSTAQPKLSAVSHITIINQTRGEECCGTGSLENTKLQLDTAVRLKLPTTFALRYDALTDSKYTDLITEYKQKYPEIVDTGIMVEIIPSLITDSNKAPCLNPKIEGKTEGQHTISDPQMSETSSDGEFLREEIGCCSEENRQTMLKRDPFLRLRSGQAQTNSLGMTNDCAPFEYKGTAETWFQAQNAFTIGYSRDARTVILDTLLAQYQKVFSTYPTVSSAWMIDTDSVNYLHDKYGVVVQQITREQWGTDSYTLYGGPPHYPYPASRNWIMNPDFDNTQAVTIVRQTVTDPLYNYGDTTSTFTSQPNDYIRAARGFDYFQTLIDNAIHQQSVGFANIGLENSMDTPFQEEYTRQLAYIAKLRDENRLAVVFPDAVGPIFRNEKITSYARTEGNRQAIWITTPNYRARVIRNNNVVSITDLRLYSKDLKDPYSTRVAKHEGYWVVPFLIDGSRWYAWKDMEKYPHKFIPIMTDLFVDSSRIEIARNVTDLSVNTLGILGSSPRMTGLLQLNDNEGQNVADFGDNTIHLLTDITYHGKVPSSFPVVHTENTSWEWMLEGKSAWSLKKTICRGRMCEYSLAVDTPQFSQAINAQYPYLYPESVGRELSNTYTRVSVNNTFAIAGRNPVRLVLEPHDAMNFPIILDKEAEITVDPDDTAVTRLGKLVKSQSQYIDLDRSEASKVKVNVTMKQKGEEFKVTKTVYFAPNCKKDWQYCVFQPIQGVWYLCTKISDWWSGRK